MAIEAMEPDEMFEFDVAEFLLQGLQIEPAEADQERHQTGTQTHPAGHQPVSRPHLHTASFLASPMTSSATHPSHPSLIDSPTTKTKKQTKKNSIVYTCQ